MKIFKNCIICDKGIEYPKELCEKCMELYWICHQDDTLN